MGDSEIPPVLPFSKGGDIFWWSGGKLLHRGDEGGFDGFSEA